MTHDIASASGAPASAPQAVAAPGPRRGRRASRAGQGHTITSGRALPYGLLAPILIFECVFVLYPIVRGFLLAFQNTSFGLTKWVGVANFSQMVHDAFFWGSVRTTLEFTLSMVVIWLGLGLLVALLMNWNFKGRSFFRAALALPWALPDVPTVLTFTVMLDPNFGVLNRVAAWIPGVHHDIKWLTSPTLAFVAIVIMVGWKGFPFFGLIILSSLQGIPDDLYEAARVDGAGPFQRFRAITFPSLIPTLAFLSVLAFIFSFQQFSLIYLSTGGGPGTSTSTLSVLIYNEAFQDFNYNYASAVAVVGLALALVGTLLFVIFERRVARARMSAGSEI
ncbi:MAG: sugar ABC transporter permease [Actinobacteria bacterium]|nr:sugar ABC transporter permease [Actinomycetota bacterium]